MNKLELVKKILQYHNKADEWMNKVPHEISSAIFSNPYVNNLCHINELLIDEMFCFDMVEDIYWYLYGRGIDPRLEVNGNTYIIDTLDDFMNYLYECYDDHGNSY